MTISDINTYNIKNTNNDTKHCIIILNITSINILELHMSFVNTPDYCSGPIST